MMCGCTPVATDCPTGPSELLGDGRVGFLVPMRGRKALACDRRGVETPTDRDAFSAIRSRRSAKRAVVDRHFALLGMHRSIDGGGGGMRIGINATCLNDRPSGARQRFAGIFQGCCICDRTTNSWSSNRATVRSQAQFAGQSISARCVLARQQQSPAARRAWRAVLAGGTRPRTLRPVRGPEPAGDLATARREAPHHPRRARPARGCRDRWSGACTTHPGGLDRQRGTGSLWCLTRCSAIARVRTGCVGIGGSCGDEPGAFRAAGSVHPGCRVAGTGVYHGASLLSVGHLEAPQIARRCSRRWLR